MGWDAFWAAIFTNTSGHTAWLLVMWSKGKIRGDTGGGVTTEKQDHYIQETTDYVSIGESSRKSF
jgi:hypothetical protein